MRERRNDNFCMAVNERVREQEKGERERIERIGLSERRERR